MSNVALLSFNDRAGKWIATYAGRVLASSVSKEYVIRVIQEGRCNKAKNAGVTCVREIGESTTNVPNDIQKEVDRFGINERFDFLIDFVHMVSDRTSPSLLVTGEGGLGKTYTVNKALKDAGMVEVNYIIDELAEGDLFSEDENRKMFTIVKGYSTAKGLYRTLYENRERIVIFDDCDNALKDPVSLNLLKGALDSYDKRTISWNSESWGDDLPKSFTFKGGIIFISNMPLYKIDQAIRSRCICVDLSMNTSQKIERMGTIIKTDEFLPEYHTETKLAALEFLDSMKDHARELSLRTLISVTKVASRGNNWKRRAEYLLTAV